MKFKEIKLPSNKKFGFFFSFIFLFLSIFFYINNSIYLTYIFSFLTLVFFGISILKESLLYPLNISWMYLGFLIGAIVNPIVLGLIFFVLISPIAIISKIFGRDELVLSNRGLKSYWTKRVFNKHNQTDFKKQY